MNHDTKESDAQTEDIQPIVGLDEDDDKGEDDDIDMNYKNIIKVSVPKNKVKQKKENGNNVNDDDEDSVGEIEMFELTIKEAELSKLMAEYPNYYDLCKSNFALYGNSIVESKLGVELKIPFEICKLIVSFSIIPNFLKSVPARTMKHCVDYLKHHNGNTPGEIACPVRSVEMVNNVSDPWDAEFIDQFTKAQVYEIILAANYLDINSLVHLGCAKIAVLIKQLDQKEINRIIEEEEKYRREQQAQIAYENNENDDESDENDENDKTNQNNTNNDNNNGNDNDETELISKYSEQKPILGSAMKPK